MWRCKKVHCGLETVFRKTSQSVMISCPSSVRMTTALIQLWCGVSLQGRDSLENGVVGLDLDAWCWKVLLYEQPQPSPWAQPCSPGEDVWESTCLGIICLASHVNFLYLSVSANPQYGCPGKVWYFWRDGETWTCVSLRTRRSQGLHGLFEPVLWWRGAPGPEFPFSTASSFRRQELLNDLFAKIFR